MNLPNLQMRHDLLVRHSLNIYDKHVKNGMIQDPEGKFIAAAEILDATGASRDAISLALLCPMPEQTHDRLEREDLRKHQYLVTHVREWQRLVQDDFRGVYDFTEEVKAVTLAVETARLQRFMAEMGQFEANHRAGKLEGGCSVPAFMDMERCEMLRDLATGGEGNLGIDLLFKETLEQADRPYQLSVMLVRQLGTHNPVAAAERLEKRKPFGETKLLDEPVVREAYKVIGGAPLMRERDFEMAVETGVLLSTIPRVTGSTVAAALVDLALRGRNPSSPLQADLGVNVARTLKDISIYTMEEPGEVRKATAEFRQILLAQGAHMLREDICEGKRLLQHAARGRLAVPSDLREAFNEFAEKKGYLREFVLPAAGKTGAPALDKMFRRRYGTFARMLKQQGRKPTP